MSDELADTIARRFIARSDVKAVQRSNGDYMPVVDKDGKRIRMSRGDIKLHIAKELTLGHYLLNQEDVCKLFAFDIDLEKNDPRTGWHGWLPVDRMTYDNADEPVNFVAADPRLAWQDRKHPGRPWMKLQFRLVANKLMRVIHEELELPCAAAYSGGKGIHVYAFTGPISAKDARLGAQMVMDSLGEFKPTKGENFFKHVNQDPFEGYPNLSIEIFPKQDSLAGKDLGNLMRLPLGKNWKNPKDQTFFLDMTAPIADLTPVDPMWALGEGALNPWKRPGE